MTDHKHDNNTGLSQEEQRTWRKPVGMLAIIFIILIWSGIAVTLIDHITALNFWLQLPIYIFFGIVWIFPMKPLLLWMNTGKFRH